jgi:hypothetical protein
LRSRQQLENGVSTNRSLNMSEAEHVYTPPREHSAGGIPAAVASYLDGENLLTKMQALRLSTVDADGWPHAALLSAGDMLALSGGRIRFAIFPRSGMAANLARDGRITMSLSLDGGMWELRMRARRLQQATPEVPLACFEAQVVRVREHVAPYADVTTGITFVLHDPHLVLSRWQRQIAALRAAA